MVINYDKIFSQLTEKAYKKILEERKKDDMPSEKEESKEEAKSPEIIAKECMQITEDIHGGNEDAKEVQDGNGENGDGQEMEKNGNSTTAEGGAFNQNNIHLNEECKKIIREKLQKKKPTEEIIPNDILTKKIEDIVKYLSKLSHGDEKKVGFEKYDTNKIAKHILTGEEHKIINDKYEKRDGRIVQFFIDSSGSNVYAFEGIKKSIENLNKQGYTCYIADCGNGFSEDDLKDSPWYNTREKMKEFKGAILRKTLLPSIKTAKKMAEEADFSVILADFDGLSSISELSTICNKERMPYFINTENRYEWDEACEHNWVSPDFCTYPQENVFDIGYLIEQCQEYHEEKEQEESEKIYEMGEFDWKMKI